MHHVDAGGGLRTVRESHCRVDDDEIARCTYWLLDHHARTRVASSRLPLYLPQRISCLTPGNAYLPPRNIYEKELYMGSMEFYKSLFTEKR